MMIPDVNEALRYLGAGRGAPEALRRQAEACAAELAQAVQPSWVYRVFPLELRPAPCIPALALELPGRMARTMLSGCDRVVLLACTLGAGFESLLRAEQARDMARAVILDACGSALVEQGCDALEQELAARLPDCYRTDRFSPGYGDLPLDLQTPLCAALNAGRRLGLQVTQSLLLCPSKSVTAVIGLSDQPQMARIRGCAHCSMAGRCSLRKGGQTCGI